MAALLGKNTRTLMPEFTSFHANSHYVRRSTWDNHRTFQTEWEDTKATRKLSGEGLVSRRQLSPDTATLDTDNSTLITTLFPTGPPFYHVVL